MFKSIKIILGFYKLFRKCQLRSTPKTTAASSIPLKELEDSTLATSKQHRISPTSNVLFLISRTPDQGSPLSCKRNRPRSLQNRHPLLSLHSCQRPRVLWHRKILPPSCQFHPRLSPKNKHYGPLYGRSIKISFPRDLLSHKTPRSLIPKRLLDSEIKKKNNPSKRRFHSATEKILKRTRSQLIILRGQITKFFSLKKKYL